MSEVERTPRKAITKTMRRAVALRYGCAIGMRGWIGCSYCGDPIEIVHTERRVQFLDQEGRPWPELDHVEPLYWGGPHTAENLVPACLRCNRSKGPRRLTTEAAAALWAIR